MNVEEECQKHGLTTYRRYSGQRRCLRCEQERKAALLVKKRQQIDALKHGKICVDCKQQWPVYVLDYHHRDKTEKLFSIGRGMVQYGMDAILLEIEKCELLCANCHRIREHQNNKRYQQAVA